MRHECILLMVLLFPSVALAHRVDVWAYVRGEEIVVESYYGGGKPVSGATIKAIGPSGELLARGKIGREGQFTFSPDRVPIEMQIVVDVGDGHRGERTLSRDDLIGLADLKDPEYVAALAAARASDATTRSTGDHTRELAELKVTMLRIEAAVHNLERELVRMRQARAGVSIDRVLAGVGLIMGVTGVATYMLARRMRLS